MARVTQPPQQPGQKPEDAGPPTMPLTQPDYGDPAREGQAATRVRLPAQPGGRPPGPRPSRARDPARRRDQAAAERLGSRPGRLPDPGWLRVAGPAGLRDPGRLRDAGPAGLRRAAATRVRNPAAATDQPAQQPYGYGTHQAYPGSTYQYGSGKDPSLAEWWQRLLARIIDAAVILVLASPFWLPPFATYVRRIQDVQNLYQGDISNPAAQTAISVAGSRLFGSLVLAGIAGALIAMAYDWIQHGLWGKTLGKRAVGTMVVTADTRSKIGGGAAGGRAAVYALPSAVPIVGALFAAVNELWLLWDKRRQCLHDKAARTVVIKTKGPGAGPSWAA